MTFLVLMRHYPLKPSRFINNPFKEANYGAVVKRPGIFMLHSRKYPLLSRGIKNRQSKLLFHMPYLQGETGALVENAKQNIIKQIDSLSRLINFQGCLAEFSRED